MLSYRLVVIYIFILFTLPVAAQKYAPNSVLSSGRFVKVRVQENGIYRITYADLLRMGFSQPENVRLYGYGGHLLSQLFHEHPADDLPQVPVLHTDQSILFYARGVVSWKLHSSKDSFVREQNVYSRYAFYFLTQDGNDPVPFPVESSLPACDHLLTSFNAFALHEKDAWNWATTGRELYEDYDYASGNSRQYTFSLPGITDDPGRVIAEFTASSIGQSTSFSVEIEGITLGTQSVSGIIPDHQRYTKATASRLDVAWIGRKSPDTRVTVIHARPSGTPGRLNYLVLNYQRALRMNKPFVAFRSLASEQMESTFVLSGATASTVVWDISSPAGYKRMDGTLNGDTFIFTIPPGPLREFVAIDTKGVFDGVEVAGEVPNQNLHALTGIDMIIIVPDKEGFAVQAERLAQAHRTQDHLTVQVVTASQVYNEFSSGTPDATAYRRLMKMLYDRSSSKHLLLFGDCSYDNRMLTRRWSTFSPSDFLLSYQSENSLSELTSYITDDYFGFLDDGEGGDLAVATLDIGVGRFPVRTVAEAKAVVDKTIAYMENREAGPWKQSVCFVADDGDENLHASQAETLASYVEQYHPAFRIDRVYEDAFRREATATGYIYKDATQRLLHLFEQGMLVVNFVGHGNTTAWTAENLLTSTDIANLRSPRLPLWITATCDFSRFDDVSASAGELAFLNERGGAIALLTTARTVYASQNFTINQAFMKHLFDRSGGKRMSLGDIMRLSKNDPSLYGNQNKLNFALIGDPALVLAYPDYQIQVDEFNGTSAGEYSTVKAGSKATVKGRVTTPGGELATDFNGTVYPVVFDSKEEVSTLDNQGEGPFVYSQRNKALFAGSDTVQQGRFEFTFPTPLDINYSNAEGLMSLYAQSRTTVREAGGYFNRFLVGGTDDDLPGDDQGPEMTVYLNSPDFQPGGKTNRTPLFVAELEDPNGINSSGNSIGHNLSLCIDGKPAYTYSLNDYFTPYMGDYTWGTVRFSIPELPDGDHSLTFRAWDLLNNSSTYTLAFEVSGGYRPKLLSVECTENPAKNSTTFILSHDLPGSVLDVSVAVYDLSGRILWTHIEKGVSPGHTYYIDWNLCSNSGGRLGSGVYLYRASISSGGSKEVTGSRKIMILAQ